MYSCANGQLFYSLFLQKKQANKSFSNASMRLTFARSGSTTGNCREEACEKPHTEVHRKHVTTSGSFGRLPGEMARSQGNSLCANDGPASTLPEI